VGDGVMMACGTAQGQVQIYGIRSFSSVCHPASAAPEGMLCHRVTVLCQLGPGGSLCRGNVLAAGDAVGNVHLLDLRKLSTGGYATSRKSRSGEGAGLVGQLVGPGSSVRQLAVHHLMPNVLACVGLDCKLWTCDVAAVAAALTMMRLMMMTTMQL
jgi:hypothetical protein